MEKCALVCASPINAPNRTALRGPLDDKRRFLHRNDLPIGKRHLFDQRIMAISKHYGKWKCQVRKKGFPPQIRTLSTKAEATAWGREVESQMVREAYVVPDKTTQGMTVAELLQRYLREESPHKKSGSADLYRVKPLLSALGAYNVSTLTSSKLNDYKGRRLAQVAAQTVVHELTLLC